MITKRIESEFGDYLQNINNGYKVHSDIFAIEAYKEPDDGKLWEKCPCCGLKPLIWEYDNGRSTVCGCWESRYDHFSVCSESVMSVHIRTGRTAEYKGDGLRLNWNEYCATGINPCNYDDLRNEEKW